MNILDLIDKLQEKAVENPMYDVRIRTVDYDGDLSHLYEEIDEIEVVQLKGRKVVALV